MTDTKQGQDKPGTTPTATPNPASGSTDAASGLGGHSKDAAKPTPKPIKD